MNQKVITDGKNNSDVSLLNLCTFPTKKQLTDGKSPDQSQTQGIANISGH